MSRQPQTAFRLSHRTKNRTTLARRRGTALAHNEQGTFHGTYDPTTTMSS